MWRLIVDPYRGDIGDSADTGFILTRVRSHRQGPGGAAAAVDLGTRTDIDGGADRRSAMRDAHEGQLRHDIRQIFCDCDV